MKKVLMIFLVLAFVGIFIGITLHNAEADTCITVKDRALWYSSGHYLEFKQRIKPGFDPFGYNYQAHLFNGYYANAYLGRGVTGGLPPYEGDDADYYQRLVVEGFAADLAKAEAKASAVWCWPYRNVALMMKWNDAWLSNKDCDDDGLLDRYYGFESYIGSGAWITNHMQEDYPGENGKKCSYVYFTKIVAVPETANEVTNIWYDADGIEIGPEIWGSFATVQSIYNDPCGGFHGVEYLSPAKPGFGKWKE